MTSILKSDSNSKNGIILKESTKKFVEATSTSGCDSEMSEITSSIPHSLSLNTVVIENSTKNGDLKDFPDTKIIEISEVTKPSVSTEITYELEDIIDGFSIFSFVTDEDLMKFSVKHDKVNESINESECNNKNKKFARTKKQIKIFKNSKESTCNDECIDIYDFQANSESSPSSKHSSVIFKKSINKGHSAKYVKKSKYKFKNENNSSLSEENSSNTSVTESHNLSIVDGHNDSPQPTSNDDNNVVSTTTPDNLNIELRKSESLNNSGKSHSPTLKTASLRLFKLEDELSMTSINRTEKSANNIPSALTVGSENEKSVLWDFQFGVGYAWTLALFTVVSAYSVIVPIITPFGLTYLLLKHLVDRYNMIHVNVPSIVHNSVHSNAAQLMQFGLALTQITVTVYVSLRRGTTDFLSICCFLAFVLGLMLTFGRTLKRWISSMSWIKYNNITKSPSNIVRTKSMDLENLDEDGFIMVDEIKNSVFVPPQMSNGIDISLLEKIKTARSSLTSLNDDSDTVPFHSRNYGAAVPNLY